MYIPTSEVVSVPRRFINYLIRPREALQVLIQDFSSLSSDVIFSFVGVLYFSSRAYVVVCPSQAYNTANETRRRDSNKSSEN